MLKVKKISKNYRTNQAINELSFDLSRGEILAIAGPNGSGKTTLLRILARLLMPTKGNIYFNNLDTSCNQELILKRIGYMPEDGSPYLRINAYENLSFHLSFYDIEKAAEKITFYLKLFDLWEVRQKLVGQYSKGMRQKLLFIRSVIHEPELILLDEPFTALDPIARNTCKYVLKNLRATKKAVIISSHSLADLAMMCDYILCLKRGRRIFYESIKKILQELKETGLADIESYYLKLMEKQ